MAPRTCVRCKKLKRASLFPPRRKVCLECDAAPSARSSNLWSLYRLTAAGYDAKKALQQGRCAICRDPGPLVIDHDHVTTHVRGLLCPQCNVGLGAFRDDPAVLRAAADYLGR